MKSKTQLGCSPLTGQVYVGKVNLKNPTEWVGKKIDVTSDFIQVLLQKFEPGFQHSITVNGKPKFTLNVQEVKDAE